MKFRGYDVDVEKLSFDLGGGFVAFAPALKGCIADGATRDQALHDLEDAISCWLDAARTKGHRIPLPNQPPKS